MKPLLVLFCARIDAHAGVVLDVLSLSDAWEIAGFFDDAAPSLKGRISGIPVLGTITDFPRHLPRGAEHFFVCTGNNRLRARCFHLAQSHGLRPIRVIHPSAVISPSVSMGEGVFIGANVTITHNVRLGKGVLVNTAATVEHDNVISDFANISPGCTTSGRVTIGREAFLGTAVAVIPDIEIGAGAYVAAGAVVTRNVPANAKVAGVPARPME